MSDTTFLDELSGLSKPARSKDAEFLDELSGIEVSDDRSWYRKLGEGMLDVQKEGLKGIARGWVGANKSVGSVMEYTGRLADQYKGQAPDFDVSEELGANEPVDFAIPPKEPGAFTKLGKEVREYWTEKEKPFLPEVESLGKADTFEKKAKWAFGNIGQMGSQVAVTLPFMFMGGPVAQAPKAATWAGRAGQYLINWAKLKPMDIPIALLEAGEITEGQMRELDQGKTDQLSPIRALAATFLASKLEELGTEKAFAKFLKFGPEAAKFAGKRLGTRVFQAGATSGFGESAEEFFQSYAEQFGINPSDLATKKQFINALEGAAAGLVGGIALGGIGGAAARRTYEAGAPEPTPTVDTKTVSDIQTGLANGTLTTDQASTIRDNLAAEIGNEKTIAEIDKAIFDHAKVNDLPSGVKEGMEIAKSMEGLGENEQDLVNVFGPAPTAEKTSSTLPVDETLKNATTETIQEGEKVEPGEIEPPATAEPVISTEDIAKKRKVSEHTVHTEDVGDIDVRIYRNVDGSVAIIALTGEGGVVEYNSDFAKGKDDATLLSYTYEPLGYTGNTIKNDVTVTPEDIDKKAHEAATSPENELPEPTEGQIDAGNYKKGHVKIQGLDISIENPKGSKRYGVDKKGNAWESELKSHYGYIRRTEGKDGDHVDVFIGENPESQTVYVVNQMDPDTKKFDEHKVMIGYDTPNDARFGYLANYEKGWKGLKNMVPMTMDEFKTWLKEGDTTKEAGKPEAIAKEPWQMTKAEYVAANPDDAQAEKKHKLEVATAFQQGKEVPPEVAREYADVAKTFGVKVPKAEEPEVEKVTTTGHGGMKKKPGGKKVKEVEEEKEEPKPLQEKGQETDQKALTDKENMLTDQKNEEKESAAGQSKPTEPEKKETPPAAIKAKDQKIIKEVFGEENREGIEKIYDDVVELYPYAQFVRVGDTIYKTIGASKENENEFYHLDKNGSIWLHGNFSGYPAKVNEVEEQWGKEEADKWKELTEEKPKKTKKAKTITDETPYPYYTYFTKYPKFLPLINKIRKGMDLNTDPSFISFTQKFNEDMSVGNIPQRLSPSGNQEWLEDEVLTLIKDEMDRRKSGGTVAPVTLTLTDEELQEDGFIEEERLDEMENSVTMNIQGIKEELYEEGYSEQEITTIIRGIEAASANALDDKALEETLASLKNQVKQSRKKPKEVSGGELFDTSSMFSLSGNQPTITKTFKPNEKKGSDRLVDVEKQTTDELQERLSENTLNKWPDGRLRAQAGDKVYQAARGMFGTPAYIHGIVYQAKNGSLRVRVESGESFFGSGGLEGKTYEYNASWTVENDPHVKTREAEKEAKAKAERDKQEKERQDYQDAIKKNVETYGKLTYADLEPGDVIEHFDGTRFTIRAKESGFVSGFFNNDQTDYDVTPGRLDAYHKVSGEKAKREYEEEKKETKSQKISVDTAKALLKLPLSDHLRAYGNYNIALRRQIMKELTGKDVPAAKAGAMVVYDTLLKEAEIEKESQAYIEGEGKLRAWLENIAGEAKEAETPTPITYEEFSKLYRDAFEKGNKYTPDQAGFNIYTDAMARLSDNYPEYMERFDKEVEEEAYGKKEEETKPEEKKGRKVEEAGEELTYNKRNRIRTGKTWDDISGLNDALKAKETVKPSIWPKPDYQQMVNDGKPVIIAHLFKQIYDSIANAPMVRGVPTDADFKLYIDAIQRIRTGVEAWMNNPDAIRMWAEKQAKIAGAFGGKPTSLTDIARNAETLMDSVYPGGWKDYKAEVMIVGANKVLGALQPGYDEVNRAIRADKKGWPGKQEAWQIQGLKVISRDTVEIREGYTWDKDKNKTPVFRPTVDPENGYAEFDTRQEAKAWISGLKPWLAINKRDHIIGFGDTQEEATEAAREYTKKDKKDQISDKGISVEEAYREGPARRLDGEDITAEKLSEVFGFRGVNFGNWMPDNERQLHLNHAYDSFHDLADILGVPPEALSLNGMLGVAFGAQGTGQYAAHFVPGVNEINLTRTAGAGSLAHEFGHALDHYFATQAGIATSTAPYLSEHSESRRLGEGIRPEIVSAFKSIVTAMNKRPQTEEELKARRKEVQERGIKQLGRWLDSLRNDFTGLEEEYDKLADRVRNGDYGDGKVAISPTASVYPVLVEMRELFKKGKGRLYSLDNIKAVNSWIDSVEYAKKNQEAEITHIPQVDTEYAKNAYKLDKEKGGKQYWSTNTEKFARAFDAYVSDTIEKKAIENTYLSHTGREGDTVPTGEERTKINKAFQTLVDTIETKPTDKGRMMFRIAPLYHGTPYKFDRFSTEKIGTGEGAQAFGWGLYFTDQEDIARYYANNLTYGGKVVYDGNEMGRDEFIEAIHKQYPVKDLGESAHDYIQDIAIRVWSDYINGYYWEDTIHRLERIGERAAKIGEEILSGIERTDTNERVHVWPKGGIRVVNKLSNDDRSLLWDLSGRAGWYKNADYAKKEVIGQLNSTVKAQEGWEKRARDRGDIKDADEAKRIADEARRMLEMIDEFNLEFRQPQLRRNIYKVSLHEGKDPNDYDYLEWNKKPSKEQMDKIYKSIKQTYSADNPIRQQLQWKLPERVQYYPDSTTGEKIYSIISDVFGEGVRSNDKETSLFLLKAGIDGIKYPAGSISGAQNEGFNYVVFDENAVTIEEVQSFRLTTPADLSYSFSDLKPPKEPRFSAVQVRQMLALPLKKWGNIGKVKVIQTMGELPVKWIGQVVEGDKVMGGYDPDTDTTYIVADNIASARAAVITLVHEVVGHRGIDAILGPSERKVVMAQIAKAYEASPALQTIARTYGYDMSNENDRIASAAEMIARMAEMKEQPTIFKKIMGMIRAALRRVMPDLKWNDTDIMHLIERSRRFSGVVPKGKTGMYFKKAIDTSAENFKKWFGKSKVVDENGKPLVVYHGTNASDFDTFDTNYVGMAWITPATEYANAYADDVEDARVYPLYAKIENPFDFGFRDSETQVPISEMTHRVIDGINKAFEDGTINKEKAQSFIKQIRGLEEVRRYKGFRRVYEWINEVPGLTTALKDSGYDGLMAREGKQGKHHAYAVFSPTQIKSIYNQGTWNPEDARISYKQPPSSAPTFYSQLMRVVDAKLNDMPSKAQSIIGWLQKQQVKPMEIEEMGVEDWLRENAKDGRIDKEAFREWLKANQVEIQEVVKGGTAEEAPQNYEDLPKSMQRLVDKYNFGTAEIDEGEFKEQARELGYDVQFEPYDDYSFTITKIGIAKTKFESYTLPGGENYREILFVLPTKRAEDTVPKELTNKIAEFELQLPGVRDKYGRFSDEYKKIDEELARLKTQATDYEQARWNKESQYVSTHWSEPNVLAHVRINDRTDTEGNKILFVEEVQSDIHQQGKREGYKPRKIDKSKWQAEQQIGRDLWTVVDERGRVVETSVFAANETEAIANAENYTGGQVPDFPFKQNWQEWVMKRMIRYAAENGYHSIAFTTGEQQAERYDLSKQIDELEIGKHDGEYFVRAYRDKILEPLLKEVGISENKLSDVVGKDLATKAVNDLQTKEDGEYVTYKGIDLKVGGKGMKVFYDQIIPAFMNKYGKQWGAKVGETKIGTKNIGLSEAERGYLLQNQEGQYYNAAMDNWTSSPMDGMIFPLRSHASYFLSKNPDVKAEIVDFPENVRNISVPSLPITPAMREAVLYEGQPMYKLGEKSDIIIQPEFSPSKTKGDKDVLHPNRPISRGRPKQESNVDSVKDFAKHYGQDIKEGDVKEASPITQEQRGITQICRAFGLKAVFYETNNQFLRQFNGIFDNQTKDTLYLNNNAKQPLLFIAGHETLHSIRENHPDLYDFYLAAVKNDIINFNSFADQFSIAESEAGINKVDQNKVFEELLADFTGRQFTKKEFWDKLGRKNKRFTDKIITIAQEILRKIQRYSGLFKEKYYFADVKKAQDILVDVMAEYQKRGVSIENKTVFESPIISTSLNVPIPTPNDKPAQVKQWIEDQTDAIKATVTSKLPGNIEHMSFIERALKNPLWYDHPVMQKLYKVMAHRRMEIYHNKFTEFNDAGEGKTVAKELDRLRKKDPKGYDQLRRILVMADAEWVRDKDWTFEDRVKKMSVSEDVKNTAILVRKSFDKMLDERQKSMKELLKKLEDEGYEEDPFVLEEGKKNYDRYVIRPANEFDSFWVLKGYEKQTNAGLPFHEGINYTMGHSKAGGVEVQQISFNKEAFKEGEAEKWWNENKQFFRKQHKDFSAELAQTLRGALTLMDEWRGYYFPRMRDRGPWVVTAYKEGGDGQREYVRVQGSAYETEIVQKDLARSGYKEVKKEKAQRVPESVYLNIKTMDVQKAINYSLQKMKGTTSPDVLAKFNEDLIEQAANMMRERGIEATKIHRQPTGRVVKGYIEDPAEVYVRYLSGVSGGIAKGQVSQDATDILKEIDPSAEPQVYDAAKKYIEENLRNTDAGDKFMAFAKSVATMKFLGFNPRSALVNTTALVTTAMPAIHQYAGNKKVGMGKVSAEISKAMVDYGKHMAGRKLDGADQAIVERITKDGYDTPALTRDALGAMQGGLGRGWSRAMEWAMYMFSKTEQWNRGTTILAAYRVAKIALERQGVKGEALESMAYEAAIEATEKAHAAYGKSNLPEFAQGPGVGARAFQAMYVYGNFGHNYVQLLYDLGAKKHNIVAFTWALAAPIIIAGGAAFPFKDELLWIINGMLRILGIKTGVDKFVWDQTRKHLGDTAETFGRRGLFGLAGVDISGSLGIGVGLPTNLIGLAGAAGGVAEDIMKAGHFLSTGQTQRAWEKALPTAAANILRAEREHRTGVVSEGGRMMFDKNLKPFKPTGAETAARVFGFQSSRASIARERDQEMKRVEDIFESKRKGIYQELRAWAANPDRTNAELTEIYKKQAKFDKEIIEMGLAGQVGLIRSTGIRNQIKGMMVPTKKEMIRLQNTR